MSVTIEIAGASRWKQSSEVTALVGSNRLYRKGTDDSDYLDCRDRAEADLLVVNLNLMPYVRARIVGDPWPSGDYQSGVAA